MRPSPHLATTPKPPAHARWKYRPAPSPATLLGAPQVEGERVAGGVFPAVTSTTKLSFATLTETPPPVMECSAEAEKVAVIALLASCGGFQTRAGVGCYTRAAN